MNTWYNDTSDGVTVAYPDVWKHWEGLSSTLNH